MQKCCRPPSSEADPDMYMVELEHVKKICVVLRLQMATVSTTVACEEKK